MLSSSQWFKVAEVSRVNIQVVGRYLRTKGDLKNITDLPTSYHRFEENNTAAESY